jgi:hypothetical protein
MIFRIVEFETFKCFGKSDNSRSVGWRIVVKRSREELVRMVQILVNADLPEEEEDQIVEELKSSVSHPRVTDLIYYTTPKLTVDEVVDRALAYRPIEL